MERTHPDKPFARYADDGVIHCRTLEEADLLLESLKERMEECKPELHPEDPYCLLQRRKEEGRVSKYKLDFLGYTFRVRSCKRQKWANLLQLHPAVSEQAKKAMRQKIRRMRLQTKSYLSIEELSERINPVIRAWINYYGHFRRFEMYTVLSRLNKALVQWVRNKYKKRRGLTKASKWLEALARRSLAYLYTGQWGYSIRLDNGSRMNQRFKSGSEKAQ